MPSDTHDRARLLLDNSLAGPLAPEDRRWLDRHLAECGPCARHAELSARAVRALNGFSFEIDAEAAQRVEDAVRWRVGRLAALEAERRRARAGAALALAFTVVGSAAVWPAAGWWAAQWNLPDALWQAGFAVLWLLPSALLDAVLLWRGASTGEGEVA